MNEVDGSWNAWDDGRDGAFFAITNRLFSTSFLAGATVLLGSYDEDPTPTRSPILCRGAGELGDGAAQHVATTADGMRRSRAA